MYPEQLCEGAEELGQDDKSLLSLIYEVLHVKQESLLKGMMAVYASNNMSSLHVF